MQQDPLGFMHVAGEECKHLSTLLPMISVIHWPALLARWLCTVFVDPQGLAPLMAGHLIAPDKNPGVRPIGIGETARRIIAKAVLCVVRDDVQQAVGSLQLCAGQVDGIEAAIHAMNHSYSSNDSEAVLLVMLSIP